MSKKPIIVFEGIEGTGKSHHIKKVAFAGKRIVVFSGGDTKDDNALMDEIKAIHHGGGNGSIIGRNCFQRKREDSLKLLNQIIDIYKSK